MLYLTETELAEAKQMAEQNQSKSKFLEWILQQHAMGEKKQRMQEGQRYFLCEHDILRRDFRQKEVSETKDGKEELKKFYNPNRSNHKNVNPFHHTLVMQKAAYLVGREPTVTIKGHNEMFEKEITDFCGETFNRLLYRWVVEASNSGVSYLHIYYDTDGDIAMDFVPAEELIVFYDEKKRTEMTDVIRYYDRNVWELGKRQTRRCVEWWTKEDVTYFQENKNGGFVEEQKTPHWIVTKAEDGEEVERIAHNWGRVPFIALQNNAEETTDLEPIKGLIDAYDLLSSEGTNNLLDLVELYWVLQGYGGEAANTVTKKLQINKAVHISDSSGHIEAKQVELPMESRMAWLKLLRKDIFHFGMGVDTDSENWGKAPSGIALQFQYAMFYLKVNGMMPEIRSAMKQMFRFLVEHWNRCDGGNRNWKDIQITLNTSGITDEWQTVQMIQASKGLVSEKTLLGKHPFVEDVNFEMEQLYLERKENVEQV